ncbi:MAG TPA: cytochrome c oxidase subunit II [Gaiellaceae bacterium]|nr:cytochrome c oxidase subunit II [Gaiellaceae bacterium]
MRRGSIVQLVAIGVVCGAGAAAVALLIPWLPDPASKQADRIDFVFWFVTAISIAIFALVAAVIIYSLIKFRARPDEDMDGPPIHGNTGLEIAWTAVPAALVTAIAIVSAVVLSDNGRVSAATRSHPLKPLVVNVIAQQFAWNFQYPDFGNINSPTLKLPVGYQVKLEITSLDVIHSFWVPEFSQKQDAVPGSINPLVITPTRTGVFPVICTELCGLGHALMRSQAQVTSKTSFLSWANGEQKKLAGPPSVSGKALFTANACNSCHTFKPAGATAKIGPDLDNLAAEAKQAGQPLDQFIHQSIVSPNAYIQPGFPSGIMPQDFGTRLSKAQLDALASYLASGGKQ